VTTGLLFTVIASYHKRSMFARLRPDCRIAKMRREKPQRSVAVLNVKETQKTQEDAQLSVRKGPSGQINDREARALSKGSRIEPSSSFRQEDHSFFIGSAYSLFCA
jgi:hypothetical protein